MQERLAELAKNYQTWCDQVAEMEADLKTAKHVRDNAKESLINAMVEEELDSFGHNGRRYALQSKTKYSAIGGMKEDLFDALRASGLGDIITETVNANTLNATMNQLAEENGGELPEEYIDCVNVYSFVDVSNRKS